MFKRKDESFISIVLLWDHPIPNLHSLLLALQQELEMHYSDYEILIVRQGGDTPIVEDFNVLEEVPCIRILQLSGRVYLDVAWGAGLENAIGDFVVLLDLERDPIKLVRKAVSLCQSGSDIVIGVAPRANSLLYKVLRKLVSKPLHWIDYALPPNATSFRGLTRRAVNSVTSTGRLYHQLPMRLQKTGYPVAAMFYDLVPGVRYKQPSMRNAFRRLIHFMVFNSLRPLRLVSELGMAASVLACVGALASVVVQFLREHDVEGWSSTLFFVSVMFMMQFFILAFIGEYLVRVLAEGRGLADYSVIYEKRSRFMINQDRINVATSAIEEEHFIS